MTPAPASSGMVYFFERGAGPPLLLLHGLMVTGEMFEPVIDRLAARHRVIVPDLRGHGRSRQLSPPYTVARLASDVARLLEHLGIGSAAVLGYSNGGAVAQQLALDTPARCDRLVLACTYAYNRVTFRERVDAVLVPPLVRVLGMRRFARLVASVASGQMGKERTAWLADLMGGQDRALMATAWKEAMAFDSRKRLREIRCPTLVVAGANDHAVPMHHARALHEGIAGSRLVVVAGADHALIWTHPDELVTVTERFLEHGAPSPVG